MNPDGAEWDPISCIALSDSDAICGSGFSSDRIRNRRSGDLQNWAS
jgi:hypothetical protein